MYIPHLAINSNARTQAEGMNSITVEQGTREVWTCVLNTTTTTANWTTAGCHRCASWHGVIWGRPACRLTACCSFTVVNVLICSFCAQQTKAYTRKTCILHSRFCYTSTPDNLHSMNSQILDQITAEESFNTRRFDAKIFIRCTKCKDAATYIPAHQL